MRDRYDFSNAVRGKYAGRVDQQLRRVSSPKVWSNESVRLLAGDEDPVEVVTEKARELVLTLFDSKHLTAPIDPFQLAALKHIAVIPKSDVRDARTTQDKSGKSVIEYNPNRPKARVRFSICHELGHTLFPDFQQRVQHRLHHHEMSTVEYELEMLCNLAAAEFLLPIGSLQEDLAQFSFSIDSVLQLRSKYDVSTEAVLLRIAGLCASPLAVFAASAGEEDDGQRYRVEYVRSTPEWTIKLRRGDALPASTVARECTAIGVTAKADEEWKSGAGKMHVEMVGVSPYPGRLLPRVVGILVPEGQFSVAGSRIRFLRGDALKPRGEGLKIVAHVVNDKTPNWGAGFGKAVQSKWPKAQSEFKRFFENIEGPKLGQTLLSRVDQDVCTFQMVCQHGYGESPRPRLRYEALRRCLRQLREEAVHRNATVHMPRIGTGEAGGVWGLISGLISEELCSKGIGVTIYDPTKPGISNKKQLDLLYDAAQ